MNVSVDKSTLKELVHVVLVQIISYCSEHDMTKVNIILKMMWK